MLWDRGKEVCSYPKISTSHIAEGKGFRQGNNFLCAWPCDRFTDRSELHVEEYSFQNMIVLNFPSLNGIVNAFSEDK